MRTAIIPFFMILTVSHMAHAESDATCEARAGKPQPTILQRSYEAKLHPLKVCTGKPVDDRSACNRFVGKALFELFNNTDFKVGSDEFMVANNIANGLIMPGNAGWTLVGLAADQASLDKAQKLANEGKQVVAARSESGKAGHVALILPGQLEESTDTPKGWSGLKSPNSAAFLLDRAEKAYVGCPLAFAGWKNPKGVKIYFK